MGSSTTVTGERTKPLSPCSQLAANWAARKSVRRLHRKKKKQTLLHPGALSRHFTSTPLKEEVFSMDASTRANRNLFMMTKDIEEDCTMKHQSLVHQEEVNHSQSNLSVSPSFQMFPRRRDDQNLSDSSEKPTQIWTEDPHASSTRATSPSTQSPTLVPPINIPALVCSTPGSADSCESFVSDYW